MNSNNYFIFRSILGDMDQLRISNYIYLYGSKILSHTSSVIAYIHSLIGSVKNGEDQRIYTEQQINDKDESDNSDKD